MRRAEQSIYNILGIARSPFFTLWLIDEAHQVFSKWRQSRSFQMGAVASFAACRKQQSAVELITSQEPEIGFDIKKELNFVIYPKPVRSRYRTPVHWARTWAWEIGPKPYEGRTLADDWGLAGTGSDKERKWKWAPGQEQLLEAAGCYGSFVGIPTRAESGASLKSADIAAIDIDSQIDLVDELVLDAGAEQAAQGGAMTETFINQMLWDAWQTVVADELTGQIPISLLISRILVRDGRAYDPGDVAAVLGQDAGG